MMHKKNQELSSLFLTSPLFFAALLQQLKFILIIHMERTASFT